MTFTHDEYVAAILELSAEFQVFSAQQYIEAMVSLEQEFVFSTR